MYIMGQGLVDSVAGLFLQLFPYVLLLLLHHFLLAPLFFKKSLLIYLPLTILVLTAFGYYCFNYGNPQNFGPGDSGQFLGPPPMMQQGTVPPPPEGEMTAPPDGFGAPMGEEFQPMNDMRPPMMPDDHHRPMRPETMKLLIGLLLILADLGVKTYLNNLHTERQVDDLKAENRLHQERIDELSRNAVNLQKAETELVFKTDYKKVHIKPDSILYIEGMGEYLKIYYLDAMTPLVVLMSMKRILEQLPDDRFTRVHKSYIVNLNHVASHSRTQITVENGTVLPIGESYRVAFSQLAR